MKRQRSEEGTSTVENGTDPGFSPSIVPSSISVTTGSQNVTTTTATATVSELSTLTGTSSSHTTVTELLETNAIQISSSHASTYSSLSLSDRTTLQILSHLPETNLSHRDKRGRRGAVYIGSVTSDNYIDALSDVLLTNTHVHTGSTNVSQSITKNDIPESSISNTIASINTVSFSPVSVNENTLSTGTSTTVPSMAFSTTFVNDSPCISSIEIVPETTVSPSTTMSSSSSSSSTMDTDNSNHNQSIRNA